MNCKFNMCRPTTIPRYEVWPFAKESINQTALYTQNIIAVHCLLILSVLCIRHNKQWQFR